MSQSFLRIFQVSLALDWLQYLKQFFINVSYHILVASLIWWLCLKTEPSELDWLQVYDMSYDTLMKNCFKDWSQSTLAFPEYKYWIKPESCLPFVKAMTILGRQITRDQTHSQYAYISNFNSPWLFYPQCFDFKPICAVTPSASSYLQGTKMFQYCTCPAGQVTYNFHSSCKHITCPLKAYVGVMCIV